MYVFGGLYGFSKYLNDLHVYDGDSNTWIQPTINDKDATHHNNKYQYSSNMPCPRAWHTATAVGNTQILIFGGTSGRLDFYSDVWIYNIPTNSWFQIEVTGTVPSPRCSHTLTKIYYDKQYFDDIAQEKDTTQSKKTNDTTKKIRLRLVVFGGLTSYEVNTKDLPEKARKTILLRANQSFKRLKSAMSSDSMLSIGDSEDADEDDAASEGVRNTNEEKDSNIDINLSALSKQMMRREKSGQKSKEEDRTDKKEDEEDDEITEINKIELNDEIFELRLEA
ncbi:kelch repeat protein [Reticulomyxa filosa]|uniref:Kelch repeat protein n=1 Tax=Reticulomyxa filosa TaxID=46433 RepID=X6NBP5_RETFI|nr:kelch repeat protein [Reticulomyxa filosa]|eukprot:ETO23401.1 kelch repeat protein [Reticulomyxa filosa]